MLPLTLLQQAQNHPMLVELKNGETYNGHLVMCDQWMNINLREVICTSRDGDRFWKMPEVCIRGVNIKYLRIPDEVLELAQDHENKQESRNRNRHNQPRHQDGRQRQVLHGGNQRDGQPGGGRGGRGGGGGRGGDRGGRGGGRGGGGGGRGGRGDSGGRGGFNQNSNTRGRA